MRSLALLALLLACLAAVAAAPGRRRLQAYCLMEQRVDYPGGEMPGKSAATASAQACCDRCHSIAGCKVWTWNSQTRMCWIKSSAIKRQANVAVAVSGARGGIAPIDCSWCGRMTDSEAMGQLSAAGFTRWSSGKTPSGQRPCTDRTRSDCTALDQVRVSTIKGALALKRASGCTLMVTGGTEPHKEGTYSHENGYKLDFDMNAGGSCLTNYITRNYPYIGLRSNDKAAQYKNTATGDIYAKEGSHWDVQYVEPSVCTKCFF